MKRKFLGLFTIIWTLSVGFIGGSDSSSDDDYTTYNVEVVVISNATYNKAVTKISYWNDFTYSNVASLRLYLYNNTLSDLKSKQELRLKKSEIFYYQKAFQIMKYQMKSTY